jgi:hypothetical protein
MSANHRLLQRSVKTTTTTKVTSQSLSVVVAMLALLVTAAISTQPVDAGTDAVSTGNRSTAEAAVDRRDADADDGRLIRHHHLRQANSRSRSARSGARYDYGRSLGPVSSSGGHEAMSPYEASVRRLPVETMMSKLGDDFDPRWMSVERPSANQTSSTSSATSPDDPELLNDLRRLRFTYRDERGEEHQLRQAVVRQLERWLLDRARCEVRYTWDDLGPLFWPRWIRHGSCDTRAACSWPPGMHCTAAESDTLRVLHWQCRPRASGGARHRRQAAAGAENPDRKSTTSPSRSTGFKTSRTATSSSRSRSGRRRQRSSDRSQCRWKKVPYPVTSECFCSC